LVVAAGAAVGGGTAVGCADAAVGGAGAAVGAAETAVGGAAVGAGAGAGAHAIATTANRARVNTINSLERIFLLLEIDYIYDSVRRNVPIRFIGTTSSPNVYELLNILTLILSRNI
jgi:hypothetical protein